MVDATYQTQSRLDLYLSNPKHPQITNIILAQPVQKIQIKRLFENSKKIKLLIS